MRILLLILALGGCATQSTLSECKRTCNGSVQSFDIRGDADTFTCQCHIPKGK